jgi:hypothetical protein
LTQTLTISDHTCYFCYQTSSNKQPIVLPHHFQQAAIFAATGLHRSKQAARIAAAPFQQGAISAATPLSSSYFCYHASFNDQPVLLPHLFTSSTKLIGM